MKKIRSENDIISLQMKRLRENFENKKIFEAEDKDIYNKIKENKINNFYKYKNPSNNSLYDFSDIKKKEIEDAAIKKKEIEDAAIKKKEIEDAIKKKEIESSNSIADKIVKEFKSQILIVFCSEYVIIINFLFIFSVCL